jgi:hypothetical protein
VDGFGAALNAVVVVTTFTTCDTIADVLPENDAVPP